jgi:alpha-tubulin suppressor-like RCC1 family protein
MERETIGRWLTAATLAATVLTGAAPAQAAAKVTLHVSIAVAPATARVSSVAVVSGTLSSHKAAVPVVLEHLVDKHWVSVGHGKTTAGGRYAINLRAPKKAATWALRVTRTADKAVSSAAVHLRVVKTGFAVRASAPPSVASGVPVVVTGSVAPKATGSVWLQELTTGEWHNLASVKLTKSATFQLSQSLPTGAYALRVIKAFSTTVADGRSATLAVNVAAPTPAPPTRAALAVVTSSLPAATKGLVYAASLTASGGTPPYTWGAAGALPVGVNLSSAGVFSGFPTAVSSASVPVVVVDAAGATTSRTLTLTVGPSRAAGRTIRSWGSGALGDGANTTSSTPVQVSSLTGVVTAVGANGSGYGLLDDGTVWAWGADNADQLGDGKPVPSSVPVQVVGVSGITALATTTLGGLALRYDGTVWAWGVGLEGELGNGTFAADSTAVQVTGLTGAVAIAGGGATGYALRSDGTVWAWGEGADGELGNGGSTKTNTPVQVGVPSGVTSIAAGSDFAFALESDGTVWAWGDNFRGQLGDATNIDHPSPVAVPGLTGVKAIAGNIWNGYALKANGTVWSWGYSPNGQLGDGIGGTESNYPVPVQGLTGMTAIAAGALTGYALGPDGTVSAWGYNASGQLGAGPNVTADSDVPVTVTGLDGVFSIGSGTIAYAAYAVVQP